MPTVAVNDIEICYESFGPDDAPPLLLVMGLGAQMTLWSPGLISELLERGFRVIRFDNRDIGLSSKSEGAPPDVMAIYAKSITGYLLGALFDQGGIDDDWRDTVEFLGEMEWLSCDAATEFHGEPPTDHDDSREGTADFESSWENYPGW